MAEPSPAPFLQFEEGDGREIPLISDSVWKIGRGEQNAIVLIHDLVSRNHAMIQQLHTGSLSIACLAKRIRRALQTPARSESLNFQMVGDYRPMS